MVGLGPNQAESIGSQRPDHFRELERRRDRKESVCTTHTNKSQSRGRNHVSHEENARNMQKKIDHLKRKLHHERRRNSDSSSRDLVNDALSKALNQISKSPFTHWIEEGKLPRRFIQPTFTLYNGRTDPIEYVSHFNQNMAVHSKNEALMCKIFPSNLGPVAMRWFDGLKAGSIDSFKELTRTIGSRFITCSQAPRPLASLLSLSMREGETLKTYLDRYWEMVNEVDGDFEDVAVNTFKLGLPAEHGLRKSLTGKPVTGIRQLMDQIDKYKSFQEDHPREMRDFRSDRCNNNRPQRDFSGQSGPADPQVVNAVF
ncbi:uncharacterized protein LOC126719151 [Quercus robur]|uniref:uncharacterized protein LOC126719151 n=1 Tax=Quercus robur TaxID=38942 RepID=UPI0021636C27|nr:uncharacterized protein LOC126719151 [Quercus robur]